jgi:rubrerythrin
MPEFVNPFSGVVPGRKLTKRELVRAVRLALAAEEEATHLYNAISDATDEALAKAVLEDIADEERVHVGELQRLLNILLPDEEKWLADGATEVNEMAVKVNQGQAASAPTVGSLKS